MEVSEDGGESTTEMCSNVLEKHESGSQNSDGVSHVRPQVGSDVPSAGSLREGWARIPTADEIDTFHLLPLDQGHITEVRHIGPVLLMDPDAVRVDLRVPTAFPPGAFKAEAETLDAGEQGPEGGHQNPPG